jgi:zinc/manganese transport system ATP-binding protein
MSVLRLEGVTLRLGGRTVLRDLDLAVGQGVFVGVLGGNGAGKTTLMRAILGLVRPSTGQIAIFGRPAERGHRAIGYMPQARAGLTDLRLSGRAFIAAAAGGIGWGLAVSNAAQRADVARVIGLVDAGAYADRPVGALSGGERQRLMLAQALLGQPRLLLLDEPLAGLDPHHQAATIRLVRGLQLSLGITVLFSAHDLNPLLGALDEVLYLGGGHAALGSVDEVVRGPVLSRLYGSPVEVVRAQGRIFVVAGELQAARQGIPASERERHVRV